MISPRISLIRSTRFYVIFPKLSVLPWNCANLPVLPQISLWDFRNFLPTFKDFRKLCPIGSATLVKIRITAPEIHLKRMNSFSFNTPVFIQTDTLTTASMKNDEKPIIIADLLDPNIQHSNRNEHRFISTVLAKIWFYQLHCAIH